ncbi:MAG: TVP38/TMEM64 family protein [Cyanobacteria bacterium J06623_7]
MEELPLATIIYHPQLLLHQTLDWIQHLGWVGSVAFILLYIAATILLVPGSILTLGAGVIFGVVWGSVHVLLGALIGETCAFLLGRYLVRDWISQKMAHNPTFVRLNQAIANEGLKIILLTRLSPVFPFSLLNYAFGVTGISLRDYFYGSIGMIPMTITYVYLGSLAEDLAGIGTVEGLAHPQLQWTIKVFGLMATIVATIYLTRTARQALDKSLNQPTVEASR